MPSIILLPLLALAANPGAGSTMEHPAASCPAAVAPPPAGLEGWSRKQAIAAGINADGATALSLGADVMATLQPASKIVYLVQPIKRGDAASSGGMFAFTVPAAARYRVALGSAAWVDVLKGKTLAVSVAHGHGPDCTGVRKMVDFDLVPGRYVLQVAGSGSRTLPLMVARVP